MICPLLTIAAAPNEGGKKHCEGAERAWWVESKGMCAVTKMASDVLDVVYDFPPPQTIHT